ncbi:MULTISPECIES: hypothetical protein [Streptomyces]|jgi:hypothetical protein|uniref:Uncharacterized protein n=1 Tax=Streptomyces nymphaeiformis TaxID=2663842 RepID=A0A7W7U331_9ACTN|nr:hypothetical protein [Streptomyces nymphaeiformis]MBB4983756.1 hypothetical protein [Streptomyces nymphaeiformis]
MALPVLILALGLGGCSSDGDGATRSEPSTGASSAPAAPSAAAPSADPSAGASQGAADWAAYYDCLGAQGLKLQDTGGGQKRVDKDANKPDAIAAAERACAAKLPARGKVDPARLEAAEKLSACMRKEGVADYPDPDPATGEVALAGALAERVKGDPKVIEALKACSPKGTGGDGGTVVGG